MAPLDSKKEPSRKLVRMPGNWKLTLAYDGTSFSGWQVQPGRSTVQGTLASAIEHVSGERVLPQGSGRTDAGVHALGQVASFALAAPIPPANLLHALNRALPSSIRVLAAEPAADDFHARHSALAKTYEYRIYRGELCLPWNAPYVYALAWPLEFDAMQEAAAAIVGEHDFTSFAANDPDAAARADAETGIISGRTNLRSIHSSSWAEEPGSLLVYRVRGSGFLHHMVRNLVGTFLDVGRGHLQRDQVAAILLARDRQAAGPTAPARGLFLASVEY